ncbi:DUF1344 domain-containing protein [Roseibium aggregatum]|uniref:DUF1344 domain-containing protein n=1 Tax=Roseibium aggregatum TaxID=187304 RepID=A0A926S651_9HYPH|nr:DUF1344 domain-containing protein [Roseibium aggregatum]MBD1547161.1 DUF1344 domain-containing protein [Roseibium aggregatum]
MRMFKRLVAVLAVMVVLPLSHAFADETTGTIVEIDPDAKSIVLDDDTVYVLPDTIDPEGLNIGDVVQITYSESDSGTLVVTALSVTN